MKHFRKFLVSSLALACCSAFIVPPTVNAATTRTLEKMTTSAGSTTVWYPPSNTSGHNLTNGGTQKIQFYFSESGNKINMGFKQTSSGSNYSWYSGTVSGSSKSASKVLSGQSGYYKTYLTNNNTSVSITTKDTSYIEID